MFSASWTDPDSKRSCYFSDLSFIRSLRCFILKWRKSNFFSFTVLLLSWREVRRFVSSALCSRVSVLLQWWRGCGLSVWCERCQNRRQSVRPALCEQGHSHARSVGGLCSRLEPGRRDVLHLDLPELLLGARRPWWRWVFLCRSSWVEICSSTRAKRSSSSGSWTSRVRHAALWRRAPWPFSGYKQECCSISGQRNPINKRDDAASPSSYCIEKGVCYLVLCEASFPKKLAFAYLEDLQAEFHEQHGKKVPTVSRPYSFIEFGKNSACDDAWTRLWKDPF